MKETSLVESELFTLDHYPLFDETEAMRSVSGNKEMATQLINIFIKESIPTELENLHKAHELTDWNAIQKIAHKMKGSAIYCGAIRLRYAAQYMECYLLAGYTVLLEKLYQQLVMVISQTKQHLSDKYK